MKFTKEPVTWGPLSISVLRSIPRTGQSCAFAFSDGNIKFHKLPEKKKKVSIKLKSKSLNLYCGFTTYRVKLCHPCKSQHKEDIKINQTKYVEHLNAKEMRSSILIPSVQDQFPLSLQCVRVSSSSHPPQPYHFWVYTQVR